MKLHVKLRLSPWVLAAGLAFAATRVWLAFAFTPLHPEVDIYRRWAVLAAYARASGVTLWQAADERYQAARAAAERAGRPPPLPETRVVEYPPLAMLAIVAPARALPPDANANSVVQRARWNAAYAQLFRAELWLVDWLVFLLLVRAVEERFANGAARRRALRLFAFVVGGVALFQLLYDRLDLVLGGLVAWAVVLWTGAAAIGWSWVVLALAVAFKLAPIVLVPLFVVGALRGDELNRPRRMLRHAAIALGAIAVALLLPALRWGAATLGFVGYHAARGLQVESPLATLALIAAALMRAPIGVHRQFGAAELDAPGAHALALASGPLVVVAVAAVLALVARALRRRLAGAPDDPRRLAQRFPQLFVNAAVATLLAAMVTSKVLSPQYLLWLLPLVPLMRLGGRIDALARWGFVALCALTTLVCPYLYADQVLRLSPGVTPPAGAGPTLLGGALLGLRNAGLVALAVVVARRLDPPVPPPSPSPPQ